MGLTGLVQTIGSKSKAPLRGLLIAGYAPEFYMDFYELILLYQPYLKSFALLEKCFIKTMI